MKLPTGIKLDVRITNMREEIKKIIKCPAIESSKFLCDREAEYLIEGTLYCNIHARRLIERTSV
jgi:hypothetical protein